MGSVLTDKAPKLIGLVQKGYYDRDEDEQRTT